MGETFPTAKFVRESLVVVRLGDRDRDRADRVIPVRGPSAMKAVAVGIAKTPQVLFDPILVGHGSSSLEIVFAVGRQHLAVGVEARADDLRWRRPLHGVGMGAAGEDDAARRVEIARRAGHADGDLPAVFKFSDEIQ